MSFQNMLNAFARDLAGAGAGGGGGWQIPGQGAGGFGGWQLPGQQSPGFFDAKTYFAMNPPPPCPRLQPQAGHNDWITINDARYPHFNVCPTCYHSQLRPTPLGGSFVSRGPVAPQAAIRCDMGRFWVNVAGMVLLMFNDDRRFDVSIMPRVATFAVADGPCPNEMGNGGGGKRTVIRQWYTVRDPQTGSVPMPDWTICSLCCVHVQTLFPAVAPAFAPAAPSPTPGTCAFISNLPSKDQSTLQVLPALGACQAGTARAGGRVDMAALLDGLGVARKGGTDGLGGLFDGVCPRVTPSAQVRCHYMRELPELTACERCYAEVVGPDVVMGVDLARRFEPLPSVAPSGFTCQLYSARMRGVWREAAVSNNIELLRQKVTERRAKERELQMKSSSTQAQLDRLLMAAGANQASGAIALQSNLNDAFIASWQSQLGTDMYEKRDGIWTHSSEANLDPLFATNRQHGSMENQVMQLESQLKMAEAEWKAYWE